MDWKLLIIFIFVVIIGTLFYISYNAAGEYVAIDPDTKETFPITLHNVTMPAFNGISGNFGLQTVLHAKYNDKTKGNALVDIPVITSLFRHSTAIPVSYEVATGLRGAESIRLLEPKIYPLTKK